MLALAIWCGPVFYLNDDVTMRSILSGSYTGTPDGHAVYMKYPLAGILSILYGVVGEIPWLELFFAGCILWALVEMVSVAKYKRAGLFLGFLFLAPFYLYMHYTVIAAILVGTAAYLICAGKKRIKPVLFWLLAWTVRSQVAYLGIPFLGVALLWKLLATAAESREEEPLCLQKAKSKTRLKAERKDWLKAGCVAAAGFLLCVGINRFFYAGEDWQTYLQYNDARTTLYDYTNFLSTDYYGENFEQYGMSEEEFTILNSYNTMLDGSIDEVKVAQVAKAVANGMTAHRDEAAWLKECVKQYYYQMRYGEGIYGILWLAVFLVLAVLLVLGRDWISLLLLGCLGGGRSLIWVFLIWKGRFPERILLSLYMIELPLLVGMALNLSSLCKSNLKQIRQMMVQKAGSRERVLTFVGKVCAACVLLSMAGLLGIQVKADAVRAAEKRTIQQEWSTLKEYCGKNQEMLYLVDVFSAVEYSDIPYDKDAGNMMLAGGWMSASPLAQERFAAYGASDGAEVLYENEQVAFLAEKERDIAWLERYLQNRFGQCELQPGEEVVCSVDKVFVEYRVVK